MAVLLAGLAAIVVGLKLAFGDLAMQIGIITAGVVLLVVGIKDFISNGPSAQNTILILGGAIAIAVGLATAGISVLISVIVAAVAAVAAFTAAILLEKPAIMSVKDAQEALTQAKNDAIAAEQSYANAVDAAENSMLRLQEAEAAAGITGAELFAQVQSGTLDYANMTDAQKEVYKAYLDNEQKQKDLEAATKKLNDAKRAETIASYENQLALAKESGSYEEYKASVIKAFEEGTLSADEARDLLAKSMSEMSDDAQTTFMEDIPDSLKDGLDPHQYESTGTKIKKWFSNVWKDCKKVFSDVGSWVGKIATTAWEGIVTSVKWVINQLIKRAEDAINLPIRAINKAIGALNAVPGVNIGKMTEISFPRLAKGGIVNSATMALIGEQGKEAVVPLENNTQWITKLADEIANRNNTPSRIILNIDGKQLGYATLKSFNNIIEQTGELPLVVI